MPLTPSATTREGYYWAVAPDGQRFPAVTAPETQNFAPECGRSATWRRRPQKTVARTRTGGRHIASEEREDAGHPHRELTQYYATLKCGPNRTWDCDIAAKPKASRRTV